MTDILVFDERETENGPYVPLYRVCIYTRVLCIYFNTYVYIYSRKTV